MVRIVALWVIREIVMMVAVVVNMVITWIVILMAVITVVVVSIGMGFVATIEC